MKRTVLLLLACLLLTLPTVAQVPEKAAPDDLVVTAEIVGYSKWAHAGKEDYMLYAKMVIRNTTNHARDISMMDCSWDDSWLVSSEQGIFETLFVLSCGKNYPSTFTIPVGESMVFNCLLILMNGHIARPNDATRATSFRLGFLDLPSEAVWNGFHAKAEEQRVLEKIKKARAVYWSNALTTEIDLVATKEIDGKQYPTEYHLTKGGKQ